MRIILRYRHSPHQTGKVSQFRILSAFVSLHSFDHYTCCDPIEIGNFALGQYAGSQFLRDNQRF